MRPIEFRGSGSAMVIYTAMNLSVWIIIMEAKSFGITELYLMFCAIYFLVQLIYNWMESTPSEKGE